MKWVMWGIAVGISALAIGQALSKCDGGMPWWGWIGFTGAMAAFHALSLHVWVYLHRIEERES